MSTTQEIDPDGDLILVVGSNDSTTRFRVSKFALRLASPVIKVMLFGPFAEALSNKVKLPADDVEAMGLLLLVAHLQFKRLPNKVTQLVLGELAQLCDKYECAHVVQAQAIKWLRHHHDAADPITAQAMIWYGWVFMARLPFKSGMFYLLKDMPPAILKSLTELPPGCEEFLQQCTSMHIKDIFNELNEMTKTVKDSQIDCRGISSIDREDA